LPVGVALFLQQDAEGVAATRVGVKVQIIAEDLRHAHGQFGGFTSLFDRVEKRIVERPPDGDDFRTPRNLGYFGGKALLLGKDFERALGVDAVINFAQVSLDGAADGEGVSGAELPEVECLLSGGCGAASFLRAKSEFFEGRREVFSGAQALIGGNDDALASAFGFGVGQFNLVTPFGGCQDTPPECVSQHATAGQQYRQHRQDKPLAHRASSATGVQVRSQTGTRLAYPRSCLKYSGNQQRRYGQP
jgi:hypothetical protein